jgi:hypothetical protein
LILDTQSKWTDINYQIKNQLLMSFRNASIELLNHRVHNKDPVGVAQVAALDTNKVLGGV